MEKTANLILLATILFFPNSENENSLNKWVIWNVGQGSFATRIEATQCLHFDAGGESGVPNQVLRVCRRKQNKFFISHADWDHISYLKKLVKEFPRACRIGPVVVPIKRKFLFDVQVCEQSSLKSWFPKPAKRRNNESIVFNYSDFLFPGDLGKIYFKHWRSSFDLRKIKFLALAHHGSRDGVSDEILRGIPNLKMVFVSARHTKYGHPHSEVVDLIKNFHLPLIRTEHWGNIHLY